MLVLVAGTVLVPSGSEAARLLRALTIPGYPWDNLRDKKADVHLQWMLQILAERSWGSLLPAPLLLMAGLYYGGT